MSKTQTGRDSEFAKLVLNQQNGDSKTHTIEDEKFIYLESDY